MKQKKDKTFIIVMGLALVNLVYFFSGAVSAVITSKNLWAIIWMFADGIAIIGILYLLRSYKRARKITKENEEKEREEIENEENINKDI